MNAHTLQFAYNKDMTLYDRDIREPLFQWLEEKYGMMRIIEEKQTGKARADAVMVTVEEVIGIEIKSDADTYARLENQVKYYDWYYDRNYVVVGTSHALHIEEHVPAWWGIITAEKEADGIDFYEMRKPQVNPKRKMKRKITLLWRPELARIQKRNNLPAYKEKAKKFVQEKILAKIPEEQLHREISRELFERDYTLIEAELEEYRQRK